MGTAGLGALLYFFNFRKRKILAINQHFSWKCQHLFIKPIDATIKISENRINFSSLKSPYYRLINRIEKNLFCQQKNASEL